jgi:hypothetical protein
MHNDEPNSVKEFLQHHLNILYFVISLGSGFLTLLFTRPYTWYLFGQDSIPLINPFLYSQNPLYTFNNSPYFGFYFVLHLFSLAIPNPELLERVIVIIGTSIASYGILDLFSVIFKSSGKEIHYPLIMIPAVIFYQFNLFTLSVTWPSFQPWSLLMISAPYIISLFTSLVFISFNWKRFFLTFLVVMLLLPSISFDYLPFFLIVAAIYFIFGILRIILGKEKNYRQLLSLAAIPIFVFIVAFGYNFSLLHSAPYYSINQTSVSSYISSWKSESETTTILRLLTLRGYNRIAAGSPWYPWINSLPYLTLFSYITIVILLFSYKVKKYIALLPLSFVALLSVVFSNGSNAPFGWLNFELLQLKGPFLFLVNPYYFTMQFYVLFLAVLIYIILEDFIPSIYTLMRRTGIKQSVGAARIWKFGAKRQLPLKVIVILLLFLLVGASFFPFATDQVYEKEGIFINEINMNNGLPEMEAYLLATYKKPDYISLLVPISSFSGRTELLYNNNSTFIDSRGLVASIDPYPLIFSNDSFLATTVANYLAGGNLTGLSYVLQYLHIKYVIYTTKFAKVNYMMDAPDGLPYNMTYIYDSLLKEVGQPIKFGIFDLFVVPDVTPIAGVMMNPVFSNSTLPEFIDFLGSLHDVTPQELNTLMSVIISPNLKTKGNEFSMYSYDPNIANYRIFNSTSVYLVNNEGNLSSNYSNRYKIGNHLLNIEPERINGFPDGNYSTNMKLVNGSLYGTSSTFYLNGNISTGELVNATMFTGFNQTNQFVRMTLSFGNMSIEILLINQSSNYVLENLAVSPKGPYGGINIEVPAVNDKILVQAKLDVNDEVGITFSIPSTNFTISRTLYYGPNNYALNPYTSPGDFMPGISIRNNATLSISTGDFGLSNSFPLILYNVGQYVLPSIKYIISQNITEEPQVLNSNLSVSIFGAYTIKLKEVESGLFIYSFYPIINFDATNNERVINILANNFTYLYYVNLDHSGTLVFTLVYDTLYIISDILYLTETLILGILVLVSTVLIKRDNRKGK